jgi:hypothetical protein
METNTMKLKFLLLILRCIQDPSPKLVTELEQLLENHGIKGINYEDGTFYADFKTPIVSYGHN